MLGRFFILFAAAFPAAPAPSPATGPRQYTTHSRPRRGRADNARPAPPRSFPTPATMPACGAPRAICAPTWAALPARRRESAATRNRSRSSSARSADSAARSTGSCAKAGSTSPASPAQWEAYVHQLVDRPGAGRRARAGDRRRRPARHDLRHLRSVAARSASRPGTGGPTCRSRAATELLRPPRPPRRAAGRALSRHLHQRRGSGAGRLGASRPSAASTPASTSACSS